MTIKIHFKTDGGAFTDYPGETDRIILETARKIANGKRDGIILDTNGNTVGRYQVTGR